MTAAKAAPRDSTRLAVVGMVVAVGIHAALLRFVSWLLEPDPPPPCPTQRELCDACCVDAQEQPVPGHCPRRATCACEEKAIELVELTQPPLIGSRAGRYQASGDPAPRSAPVEVSETRRCGNRGNYGTTKAWV